MRDVTKELKDLRLYGMVDAWTDLMGQGETSTASSKWLIEHLLQAEHTDRGMRSIRHQMAAAKFPMHRDLAGFDFDSSRVDQRLLKQLATLSFTDTAQNAVLTNCTSTPVSSLRPTSALPNGRAYLATPK